MIHMPAPSYYPFIVAMGLLVMALSVLISLALLPVGFLIMAAGIFGWSYEAP
jgi:hypothetical protein